MRCCVVAWLGWGLWLVGCDPQRPDVLREFPPPHLAREVQASGSPLEAMPATCEATWRLFGKSARDAHRIPADGEFMVRAETGAPVSGHLTLRPMQASPALPERVRGVLQARHAKTQWTWRLQQLETAQLPDDRPPPSPRSGVEERFMTETELNGVRTTQLQTVAVKLTSSKSGAGGSLNLETQQRLDLGAHRLEGLLTSDGLPARKADLLLRCRLDAETSGP